MISSFKDYTRAPSLDDYVNLAEGVLTESSLLLDEEDKRIVQEIRDVLYEKVINDNQIASGYYSFNDMYGYLVSKLPEPQRAFVNTWNPKLTDPASLKRNQANAHMIAKVRHSINNILNYWKNNIKFVGRGAQVFADRAKEAHGYFGIVPPAAPVQQAQQPAAATTAQKKEGETEIKAHKATPAELPADWKADEKSMQDYKTLTARIAKSNRKWEEFTKNAVGILGDKSKPISPNIMYPGYCYFFKYKSKLYDQMKIDFFEQNPVIVCIERKPKVILGLNFHYLRPSERKEILQKLNVPNQPKSKVQKINMNWTQAKELLGEVRAKRMLKAYLPNRIKECYCFG